MGDVKSIGTTRDRLLLAGAMLAEVGIPSLRLGCVSAKVFDDVRAALDTCEVTVTAYAHDSGERHAIEGLVGKLGGVLVSAQVHPARPLTQAEAAATQQATASLHRSSFASADVTALAAGQEHAA